MPHLRRGLLVGIDEAGRGPIIGPMVIAGVAIEPKAAKELAELGVRDSKDLTPSQRRELFPEIMRLVKHAVIVKVPPALIDAVNLNKLEVETIACIVQRVKSLYGEPEAVYMDAVGPAKKMVAEVKRLTGLRGAVVAEPKADTRYIPVSAASIIAKVVRDEEIEKLRRAYGVRGSGYPTDPGTLEWIREAYRRSPDTPPWFVRRSWSTLKQIAPRWYKAKNTESKPKNPRQRTLLDFLSRSRGHVDRKR